MTEYELATIIDPRLEESQITATIGTIEQLVANQGCTLMSVDRWEKRRLAYEVEKHRDGTYVFFRFSAPRGGTLAEIKRRLHIAESVIRHMIVRLEPWEDVPSAIRGVPRSAAVQEAPPAAEVAAEVAEETPEAPESTEGEAPVESEGAPAGDLELPVLEAAPEEPGSVEPDASPESGAAETPTEDPEPDILGETPPEKTEQEA